MNIYRITAHILLAYFMAIVLLAAAGCKAPDEVHFPADHGPHFDSRTEWWYFTGTASDDNGMTLGFECTIFKFQILGNKKFSYLGHVAVCDPETHDYVYKETLTRAPVAGISEGISMISVTDFFYDFSDNRTIFIGASSDNASLSLALEPHEDVLLHGRDGSITMGDGLRSYYYSFTNLATSGALSFRGRDYRITSGRTWMDHQWGNFTPFGLLWDWYSLRLDDGGALMLFHFRDICGRTVRTNWTYRSAAGDVTYGDLCGVQSSRIYEDVTGACTFPLDWNISIPDIHAEFTVQPLFDSQIFFSTMTPDYWEGLCSVTGSINGMSATGSAYVELSGYCKLITPDNKHPAESWGKATTTRNAGGLLLP
jgi:predicted secreted hydrolase